MPSWGRALSASVLPAQHSHTLTWLAVQDTHLLLVTLLLCNAGCMEALPIFLNAVSCRGGGERGNGVGDGNRERLGRVEVKVYGVERSGPKR